MVYVETPEAVLDGTGCGTCWIIHRLKTPIPNGCLLHDDPSQWETNARPPTSYEEAHGIISRWLKEVHGAEMNPDWRVAFRDANYALFWGLYIPAWRWYLAEMQKEPHATD